MARLKKRGFFHRIGRALSTLAARWSSDPLRWGPPIGCYRALWGGEVNIVVPRQEALPAREGSMRVLAGMYQHLRQPWPIFWKRIPHAHLVTFSLAELRFDRRLMSESIYDLYASSAGEPALDYWRLPPPVKLAGPWTSLVSRWCSSRHNHYFHWMMDGLPRLALLDRFPADTRILIPAPLLDYHRETLGMMNLLDRCRVTAEEHVEIEDYYFSSPTAMTGCDNPYAIAFLREKLLPCAAKLPAHPEKIYITRQNGTRAPQHEAPLLDFLREEGWTVVAAETHSVAEQIALFSRARLVCAVHGGGLTNLLWCRPGTRVLELFADNYLNGCYEGMAVHLGLDYRHRIFPATADSRPRIPIEDFVPLIRSFEQA